MITLHPDLVFVGERICKARRENHFTQAQLAKMAGCSVAALRKIERGQADFSMELLFHLSRLLNRTYAYFFSDEDRQAHEDRLCRQILEMVSLLDDYAVSRLKKLAEARKA